MTLDLKATEIASVGKASTETSIADDPRTPEHTLEAAGDESRAKSAIEDDPRTPEHALEAAGENTRGAPDMAAASPLGDVVVGAADDKAVADAGAPPTQDVGEAPPELVPAPDAASGAPDARAAETPEPSGYSPEIAAAPAESRRRGGAGLTVGAAIFGGLVGAGLFAAAERYWLKSGARSEARLAQLEQRFAAVPSADTGALERRLAALEGEQKALEGRLRAVQSSAETAAQRADEALKPAAAAAGASTAAVDEIAGRLAALDDRIGKERQSTTQAVQQLDARLAQQSQRVDTAAAQVKDQDQKLASLAQQLTQQGQKLDALAKQFTERGPEASAALRVVAADRLIDALRDGTPYAEAYAALTRLRTEPARLAALEPFASSGAPTAAALAQEFKPIADRLLAEARGPANSWSDRLTRMAQGVITVRPINDAGASSTPALVDRIESALGRGALGEAAAAWDALPEPARKAAEAFGRKLKARAAAEDAARAISNQALAALDASTR